MPELPEVETVRIGLQKLLPGLQIKSVDFDWPKSFPNSKQDVSQFVIDAKVMKVARRAKVLLIELSSKYSLVVHLKMTGQLVFVSKRHPEILNGHPKTPNRHPEQRKRDSGSLKIPDQARNDDKDEVPNQADAVRDSALLRFGAGHPNDSLIGKLPDKSTRVTIGFNGGGQLYFNDQRKFGWMRLIPTVEVVNLDFFRKVGPEPLSSDFTWKVLRDRSQRRKNSNIKAVLLDQTVLAGVGNIYADESLWGAKIHPLTLVKNISDSKFRTLYEEIVFVLELAIEKGGSTDKNYVDAEGKKGSYMSFARVFRRDGQACPRCGTTIEKIRVAGRGTHICPKCQKFK